MKDQRERYREETRQGKLRDRRKKNGETEKETQEERQIRDRRRDTEMRREKKARKKIKICIPKICKIFFTSLPSI